jgi:heme/copper-type cytochrome/quinol oxidase subunit 3
MVGVSVWLNGAGPGFWLMLTGAAIVIFMIVGWFGEVIRESEGGRYNDQVDMSFRMGMFWFIFSEVMFFAAFFGALFYARNMAIPWLGGDSNNFFTNLFIWTGYESTWPTNGPGNVGGDYEVMGPFGLPLIKTAILLTSSATITIAHHALIHNQRLLLKTFLATTFLLGFIFVFLQAEEYIEAYQHMNLTLGTGVYGSTLFRSLDEDRLDPLRNDTTRWRAARLADVLAERPVDGDAPGRACLRVYRRERGRLGQVAGGRGALAAPSQHHVGARGVTGVEPDVSRSRVTEGEVVVVAGPPADADLQTSAAAEPPIGERLHRGRASRSLRPVG